MMDIPSPTLPRCEFCNPLAFIFHLASLSMAFFNIMESIACEGVLRVILYIDEVEPGNPLRHDTARKLQALHWCFAEWPRLLLARAGAWLIFCVLRSRVVHEFPGGVSQFMKLALRQFFANGDNTTQRGVLRRAPDGRSILAKASFGGFLGDAKALKEIFDCKGSAGIAIRCRTRVFIAAPRTPNRTRIYTHIRVHVRMYVCVRVYVRAFACMQICMHICMCVCLSVCL